MNPAPSPLEPGNPILGVFGYLDTILTPELIADAVTYDVETIREHLNRDTWPHNGVRWVVHKAILETFRLQYWGCPLRKELDKFRLYYREDMADALTGAYFLQKRGENPIKALEADYSLKPYGLLTFENIEEVRGRDQTDDDYTEWRQFERFYKSGDRLIGYRWPSSLGLLLVRGDRLVWEYETIHMNISAVSLRWKTDYEHFLSLGGNAGFLAGDFVWPDPNWVNPVTDEEESASLRKTVRGRMVDEQAG